MCPRMVGFVTFSCPWRKWRAAGVEEGNERAKENKRLLKCISKAIEQSPTAQDSPTRQMEHEKATEGLSTQNHSGRPRPENTWAEEETAFLNRPVGGPVRTHGPKTEGSSCTAPTHHLGLPPGF